MLRIRTLLCASGSTTAEAIFGGWRHVSTSTSVKAMNPDVATGVNIYAKGEDPKLGPDEDYPDWLWTLLDTKPTMKQLQESANQAGSYEALETDEFFRLVKLDRKKRIKQRNLESKKG